MRSFSLAAFSGLTLVSMIFTGCETPGEGAAHGALAGAAIGALAGGNIRSAGIGAAAGAAAGALIGHENREERRREYYGYEDDRAYGAGYTHYRVARPTNRYGFVTSPYRPYALVDVRGFRSGVRVVDPVSGRTFINP